MSDSRRIVVMGLGNRFRGDDGVGPHVVDQLSDCPGNVSVFNEMNDALAIMEAWDDASLAIVVDAAATGQEPGTVHRIEAEDGILPTDVSRCSSHGLGLAEAIAMSASLDRQPHGLVVYGIEAAGAELGAPLSREVTDAAERVAEAIRADIAIHAHHEQDSSCTKHH